MILTFIFYFISVLIKSTHSSPNIVIFLADDLGFGDLGCFGNSSMRTPNIDELAKNGIKFNHHIAASAVCTPSRAALLTGRYPIRSGMESSNINKVFLFVAASGGLPENETTFAMALKTKNYKTALIGKWHLGNDCKSKGDGCHHPLNHGFDYFYGLPLTNLKDFGTDGDTVISTYIPNFFTFLTSVPVIILTIITLYCRKHKVVSLFCILLFVVIPSLLIILLSNINTINGIVMENMDVVEQPVLLKGLTQRFVAKAKLFLKEQKFNKQPFLLYMPFVHVHTALFCANRFDGKSKHGRYGDNIEEMDWAVGEVMSTLFEYNMLKDTFVYFSSDNGGHIEEVGKDGQREGGYNGVLKGGKTMGGMEGGIRVPTIISWRKRTGEINLLTSQMDLFPTLMELADVSLPNDRIIDGKSLVPLLNNVSRNHHEFLLHYCGKYIHAATLIEDSHEWKIHWTTPKFIPGTYRCPYVCHCFGDYVIHHKPPLLYDLNKDLSESKPIDVSSNSFAKLVIKRAEILREKHMLTLQSVPDQFSMDNTIWKPWLQPCCSLPFCRCKDAFLVSHNE